MDKTQIASQFFYFFFSEIGAKPSRQAKRNIEKTCDGLIYKYVTGCTHVGQFLYHPFEPRCKYLECGYGPEPWTDAYGNIQLYAVERSCANGAGVPYNYFRGYRNPCTDTTTKCPAKGKS